MTADPGRRLAEALRSANFLNFRGAPRVETIASRPWASASFAGARHRLSLSLEGHGAGEAAAIFLAGIQDHQVTLEGYVVADIFCHECELWDLSARLGLEALTMKVD